MATTGSPSTHVSPHPDLPEHSLLEKATFVAPPSEDWLRGFNVVPFGPGDADVGLIGCEVGSISYGARIAEQECEALEFDPFLVYATDDGGLFKYATAEENIFDRARRNRELMEPKLVERQVWRNALGVVNFTALSDAPFTAGTGVGYEKAIPLIADTIAARGAGGPAVIHMRPGLFELLSAKDFINDGRTANGHLVISGSGYDGSAPNGAAPSSTSEWVYVTSEVFWTATAPETVPSDLSEAVLITSNDATASSMRAFGVAWDTSALHFAVEVNPGTA